MLMGIPAGRGKEGITGTHACSCKASQTDARQSPLDKMVLVGPLAHSEACAEKLAL